MEDGERRELTLTNAKSTDGSSTCSGAAAGGSPPGAPIPTARRRVIPCRRGARSEQLCFLAPLRL